MFSKLAWSFPEMIRHGYTQCTACHVSPTGGGVLTNYGRELAADVLSTWSYENESQFLHSSVGKTLGEKGILFGGDVRVLQDRYKDSQQLDGKFFLMHADFQTAYQTEHFTGVVSVGEIEDPTSKVFRGNFNAGMYYGLVRFTDEIAFRGGRFDPAYGINFPDHTVVTKSGLITQNPLQKYDTVEASYLTEHWTVIASASQTTDNTPNDQQEMIRTANVSYAFLNRMRVGASYWGGKGPVLDRHMYGANAVLGFTERFYNMTEIDFKNENSNQTPTDSAYLISQLAYEVHKGVIPYIQYQQQQLDLRDSSTRQLYQGVGLHLFPRPHFEISGEWDYITQGPTNANSAWAMGNYYW